MISYQTSSTFTKSYFAILPDHRSLPYRRPKQETSLHAAQFLQTPDFSISCQEGSVGP
jgi:hypothetical protein